MSERFILAGDPLLVMATLARDVSVKRLYGIG